MPFNVTQVSTMSSEQAIAYANKIVAVPSLIILFLMSFLIWLLVGIKMVNNVKRFIIIWLWAFFLSLIVLMFLILFPLATQSLINIFK